MFPHVSCILVWIIVAPVSSACFHNIVLTEHLRTEKFHTPGFQNGEYYPLGIRCQWNVSTPLNKAKLSLEFLSFDVEHHGFCKWDYVLVYDGICGNTNENKIRHCGKSLPDIFTSKGNSICVELVSDEYVRRPGFEAILQLISDELSTYLATSFGTQALQETSPSPVLSTSQLVTSSLDVISLVSSSLHHVTSSSETGIHTTLSPGNAISSSYTTKTSTRNLFETTKIPTIKIEIQGTSNQTFELCTFSAEQVSGAEGYITSPNYGVGNKYPFDVNCTIQILSETGKLELRFLDFDVEYHPSCDWDKLVVYDGPDVTAPVLANLCGTIKHDTLTSTGSVMTLNFLSDKYIGRRGFKIKFLMKRDDSNLQIKSTSYLSIKSSTETHFSSLDFEPTPVIKSSHVTVSTSVQNGGSLKYTSVSETLHVGIQSTTVLPHLNYFTLPMLLLGNGGKVEEYFDICNSTKVFSAGEEGFIVSPGFQKGLQYGLNLSCSLRLSAGFNQRIKLTFLAFNVEYHPNCKYDNLSLFDGPELSSHRLTTSCGNKLPDDVTSGGSAIIIQFISDHMIPRSGFKIKFQIIDEIPQQSTLTYKSIEVETSSAFKSSQLSLSAFKSSGHQDEIEHITKPTFLIESTMNPFVTNNEPSISVPAAVTDSTTLVPMSSNFPHVSVPITIPISTPSTKEMSFIPTLPIGTSQQNKEIFNICNVTGDAGIQGYIISPGFSKGMKYGVNLTCMVRLIANSGQRIKLTFTELDIEYHPNCQYDNVTIYDGAEQSSPKLATICGNNLPNDIESSGSSLVVKFVSDFIIPRSGFRIHFQVLNDPTTSKPTLPPIDRLQDNDDNQFQLKSSYISKDTRTLHIYSSSSKSVTPSSQIISPTSLSESKSIIQLSPTISSTSWKESIKESSKHYEAIWTSASHMKEGSIAFGNKNDGTPVYPETTTRIVSSTSTPNVISSESDISHIDSVIISPSLSSSRVYSETSQTIDTLAQTVYMCSEQHNININRKLDVFSPNYGPGKQYPIKTKCSLRVHSNRAMHLKLKFVDFQVEHHPHCKFDKLVIHDGSNESSEIIRTLCGSQPQQTLVTSGPYVYLQFISDFIIPKPGFHIILSEETSDSSTPLHRFNTVKISDTYSAEATFHTSYFTSTVSQSESQVKTDKSSIILKTDYEETSNAPQPPSSKHHRLYMTSPHSESTLRVTADPISSYSFTTESSVIINPSKTSVSYSTRKPETTTPDSKKQLPLECKGVAMTYSSPSGVVMSPGFDKGAMYPRDATCDWVIVAKYYQNIKLQFKEFLIEGHEECLWDKVVIHDGSSTKSPLIGAYCGNKVPEPITSSGGALYIRLETDRMIENRGFMANYTVTDMKKHLCKIGQVSCNNGSCIQEEWMCDGEKDCRDGEDEQNCGLCSEDRFRCGNGECIPNILQCNGNDDCFDGSDEINCVRKDDNDLLQIMYGHTWYPVCDDNWNDDFGNIICHHLLQGDFESITSVASNVLILMTIKENNVISKPNNIQKLFHPTSVCASQKEIRLKCKKIECGVRSSSLVQPYIIGGSRSYLGEWPWVVGIKIMSKFVCGGSLISEQWVVTASHCIESISASPHKVRVLIGSVLREATSDDHVRVTEIIIHPDNVYIHNADIALLRLQKPITRSDYIRPICIHPTTLDIPISNALCYVSGWGVTKMTDYYTTVLPNYLNDVKMRLIPQSKCKIAYNNRLKDTMMCAGYQYGQIDTCKGDSGSPLMCKASSSQWVLVGVTSWGETPCGQALKPGVYTRVQSYTDWLKTVSREEEPTLSCTFESHGLCGYHDESLDSFMWTRRKGDWNRPATDSTYKSAKGHYMYAESSRTKGQIAILKLPNIIEPGDKCLKFSYSFYGEPDTELIIKGSNGSHGEGGQGENTAQQLMKIEHVTGEWKSITVILEQNIKVVKFIGILVGTRHCGIALDDVETDKGKCTDTDLYRCSFDSNNLCSYIQLTDDFFDWKLIQSDTSGYHLQFDGKVGNFGDKAKLASQFLDPLTPRCLEFFFRMCSNDAGKILIHSAAEFGGHLIFTKLLWSSDSYETKLDKCPLWNKASANLFSATYSYKIVIEGVRGSKSGLIEIDNLSVYNGNCRS